MTIDVRYRVACENDLPVLVNMLASDPLGATRECLQEPLDQRYCRAFSAIDSDTNNELIVVESGKQLVGMLQLTFIPYLTHIGSWRCLIEGVRVHENYRNLGLGRQFFQWAIERARSRDCAIVQLTSNKQRTEAIRFYQSLGFVSSHEGFKLSLE